MCTLVDLDGKIKLCQQRRVEAEVTEGDLPGPDARGELLIVNPLEVRRQVLGKGGGACVCV